MMRFPIEFLADATGVNLNVAIDDVNAVADYYAQNVALFCTEHRDGVFALGSLAVGFAVRRSPSMKAVNRFLPYLLFALIAYHAFAFPYDDEEEEGEGEKMKKNGTSASLLEFITVLVGEVSAVYRFPPFVSRALGDVIGVVVLLRAIDFVVMVRRVSPASMKGELGDALFRLVSVLPFVKGKVAAEMSKMEASIEHSIKGDAPREMAGKLPREGRSHESILKQMRGYATVEDPKWESGKVSGAVYSGEREHMDFLSDVYRLYSVANQLHCDIWPSIMMFESEVCAMTADLLNGGDTGVCGAMSSGGTESILLATRTHRNMYRERGISKPEIICAVTAHAAIDKACEMLDIRLVKLPVSQETFKLDPAAVERAMTSDTIMIYSSAPNFPQGVIDPIPELSALAQRYGVGLHVDCCLGGFILPFAKKLGYDVPDFDFGCPGVTSMSVDTHKYGYSSKGTSVVLYRSKAVRRHQYFVFPDWTGGLYVTPTVAGSRPGALAASCWASLVSLGEKGFLARTDEIMATAKSIGERVAEIPGLYILGQTEAMIVCFGSKEFNVHHVGDIMTSKGWNLNSLQHPACIHMCVTQRTIFVAEQFISDLTDAADQVINSPEIRDKDGGSALYGMAASLPDGPINEMLRTYTDVVLKL